MGLPHHGKVVRISDPLLDNVQLLLSRPDGGDDRVLQEPLQVELIGVELAQKLLVGLTDLLGVVARVVDRLPVFSVVLVRAASLGSVVSYPVESRLSLSGL